MKTTNFLGAQDAERVVCEYETLRANVLGELNKPQLLILLLRQGMSAWMRALIDYGPAPLLPTPTSTSAPSVPSAVRDPVSSPEVATILADAILDAVGSAVII